MPHEQERGREHGSWRDQAYQNPLEDAAQRNDELRDRAEKSADSEDQSRVQEQHKLTKASRQQGL